MSKIRMLEYDLPLAKGYVKDGDINILFDFPYMERVKCVDQPGINLLDFIWLDENLIEELFNILSERYLIDASADELMDSVRCIAGKNMYLMSYITYAIDLLTNDTVDDRIDYLIDDAYIKEFSASYSDNDVKLIIVKSIKDDILEKQKQLESHIEKILGDADEFAPAQRLFLFGEVTNFSSSLDSEVDLRGLDENTIRERIKKENISFFEMFELNCLDDIIRFELVQLIYSNAPIRRCKLCGKLFTPKGRVDSLFCSRLMNGEDKPCIEIGPTRLQAIEQSNDPIRRAYKQGYDRMTSRKRYGTITNIEFQTWQFEAGDLRDKCLAGEISLEQFEEWLNKTKR